MRLRTIALVLLLGCGLSLGVEAKTKAVIHRPKSHVSKVKKFKGRKLKHRKVAKAGRRIKHNS